MALQSNSPPVLPAFHEQRLCWENELSKEVLRLIFARPTPPGEVPPWAGNPRHQEPTPWRCAQALSAWALGQGTCQKPRKVIFGHFFFTQDQAGTNPPPPRLCLPTTDTTGHSQPVPHARAQAACWLFLRLLESTCPPPRVDCGVNVAIAKVQDASFFPQLSILSCIFPCARFLTQDLRSLWPHLSSL